MSEVSDSTSTSKVTMRLLAQKGLLSLHADECAKQLPVNFEYDEFGTAEELKRALAMQPVDLVVIDENFPALEFSHLDTASTCPLVVRLSTTNATETTSSQLIAALDVPLRTMNHLERLCSFSKKYKTMELDSSLPFFAAERLYTSGYISFERLLRLKILFQEVLSNAVEHGNLELESSWREEYQETGECLFSLRKKERMNLDCYGGRSVQIHTSLKDEKILELRVCNEGPGFNVESALSELANIDSQIGRLESHGRGLYLIKEVADSVLWEDGGRTIVLRILLDSSS